MTCPFLILHGWRWYSCDRNRPTTVYSMLWYIHCLCVCVCVIDTLLVFSILQDTQGITTHYTLKFRLPVTCSKSPNLWGTGPASDLGQVLFSLLSVLFFYIWSKATDKNPSDTIFTTTLSASVGR